MHIASVSLFRIRDAITMLDRNVLRLNSTYNVKIYSVVAIIAVTAFIVVTTVYNGIQSRMPVIHIDYKTQSIQPPYYPNPHLQSNHSDLYGIMFDAGSTGTRIHVLHFTKTSKDSPLHLLEEVFEQIKPGLSAFAENPSGCLQGLDHLLNIAKDSIPEYKWASTPVALKATAGLRLLPQNQADKLLEVTYTFLHDSPFNVSKQDVSILDGTAEGMYIWYTVNFLRNSFFDENVPSVPCIDLGGGSSQVVFETQDPQTMSTAPKDFIEEIEIFGRKYVLYVHSYLGIGLQAARLAMLGAEEKDADPENPLFHILSSPCLPLHHEEEWWYGGVEYTVKGLEPVEDRYHECYQTARKFLGDKVHQPSELLTVPVHVFSYIVEKIEESGFIGKTSEIEEPQTIIVSDLNLIAQRECNDPRVSNAFLCMDLVYIASLMRDGFGFHDNTQLVLQKQIDEVEVSWALGAAVNLLN
ncbi:ectonucleoside triphosphate diphosphohydrolase 5-like [Glandiceps talaboti]